MARVVHIDVLIPLVHVGGSPYANATARLNVTLDPTLEPPDVHGDDPDVVWEFKGTINLPNTRGIEATVRVPRSSFADTDEVTVTSPPFIVGAEHPR